MHKFGPGRVPAQAVKAINTGAAVACQILVLRPVALSPTSPDPSGPAGTGKPLRLAVRGRLAMRTIIESVYTLQPKANTCTAPGPWPFNSKPVHCRGRRDRAGPGHRRCNMPTRIPGAAGPGSESAGPPRAAAGQSPRSRPCGRVACRPPARTDGQSPV